MKTRFAWLVSLVLIFALVLPALAQPPTGELVARVDSVDWANHPQMSLVASVRDANGVPVQNLTPADFEINEDRVPQSLPIGSVEPFVNPDVRVSVILVIDISGSMQGQPIADAKVAAARFLDKLSAQDRAAVLAFADAVNLDAPDAAREAGFTADKQPLYALIDSLQAQGGTPLYDAAYRAIKLVSQETLGNRAVVLLTDGVDEDPGSKVASQETPIQEAARSNIPVFTIALGSKIDRGYLERLARTTGGIYQETPASAKLAELFQNVSDLLKQQYRVTYTSSLPQDGKNHRALLTVKAGGRTAQAEAEFGPLPLGPNFTPEITATPLPPAATDTPLPPDAAGPLAAQEIVVTPACPPGSDCGESGSGFPLWGIIGGGGAVLLALIGGIARATRKKSGPVCPRCGRELVNGVCPDCGPSLRQ